MSEETQGLKPTSFTKVTVHVATTEELVRCAVRDKDLTAFGLLVRRYQNQALRMAYSLLGDYASAEDAVQEAFLITWQHLHQLRSAAAFPGWLRRIVKSQCGRLHRQVTLTGELPAAELPDPRPGPDRRMETARFRQRLLEEIEGLSEPSRAAFSLYYLSDCPVSEVAMLLDLSPGTVRKRLHDARRQLRHAFTDEEIQMSKNEMDKGLRSGHPDVAERILTLLRATAAGQEQAVATLLSDDPGLASRSGPHPLWGGEPQPLHVAAERGQLDIARQLIARGADVNGGDAEYDGWSPLMLAAHGGRLGIHEPRGAIVQLLLSEGAVLDIHVATLMNLVEVVRSMVSEDPERSRDLGPADATPLHFVRSVEVASILLDAGALVNTVCGWGTTAIDRASFLGSGGREIVDLLVGNGASVNACVLACVGDQDALCGYLDDHPETLESRHKVGASIVGTPLHAAALHGHVDVTMMLLDHGANINARADRGQTPLHLATSSFEVTRMLVETGADTRACDDEHGTPPADWAHFFRKNLEPDNEEIARVADYLDGLPH